jgi:hypothetical protein
MYYLHVYFAMSNTDLFGMLIDGIDGPVRSTSPVASYKQKPGGAACVRKTNNIITNVINTKNEREVKYEHIGWSLVAASSIASWTSSQVTSGSLESLDQQGE